MKKKTTYYSNKLIKNSYLWLPPSLEERNLKTFKLLIKKTNNMKRIFTLLLAFTAFSFSFAQSDANLKVKRSANQLYITDAALMNNLIPLGVFMLIASGFLIFSYYTGPYKEIIFLYLSFIAGVFGLFLLIKPNMILIAERKANKLYMTDAFFFKHRIILGITLIAASIFMLRTYFTFGLT